MQEETKKSDEKFVNNIPISHKVSFKNPQVR